MAGAGFHQIGFRKGLAGDVLALFIVAFLPVLGGECADVVDDVHQNGGTQLTQTGTGDGIGPDDLHGIFGGDLQRIQISDIVQSLAGSLYNDGLQLFAAHNRTDTGAACGTILVVHNGSQQDLLFAGGADVQNRSLCTVLGTKLFVHFLAHNAAVFPGIQQLDLVVHNVDVGPVGSFTLYDDGIPAGVLQLGTPDAAGVGAGDHTGQGGFGTDHVPTGGRSCCTGHGAGDVDQLVLRGQGINGSDALVIEHLGAQATTANEFVSQLQVQGLHPDLTGGQVNAGDFFVICTSHFQYLH